MDILTTIGAVRREVAVAERDGQATRSVIAERTYPAPREDVWEALTTAERISRWLMPISGDLRLGGRYQLEGNASGTITACDPPAHLEATWEYDGEVSWIAVRLAVDGDGTELRLVHTAHVDDARWDEFGPGAVGIGWDLTLLGLAQHLAAGPESIPSQDLGSEEGRDLMQRSSEAWCEASIASGTPPEAARAAADRTTAFYTAG